MKFRARGRPSPGQRRGPQRGSVPSAAANNKPLQAANRRDRGGNRVQVSFFGERDNPPYGALNLHAVWDVHMVRRLIADRGGESAVVSAPLAAGDRSAWEPGSIAHLVHDSHPHAADTVYAAP